jgi:hypothetical protein
MLLESGVEFLFVLGGSDCRPRMAQHHVILHVRIVTHPHYQLDHI